MCAIVCIVCVCTYAFGVCPRRRPGLAKIKRASTRNDRAKENTPREHCPVVCNDNKDTAWPRDLVRRVGRRKNAVYVFVSDY